MLEIDLSKAASENLKKIALAYEFHVAKTLETLRKSGGQIPTSSSIPGMQERRLSVIHPMNGEDIAEIVFRIDRLSATRRTLKVLKITPRGSALAKLP